MQQTHEAQHHIRKPQVQCADAVCTQRRCSAACLPPRTSNISSLQQPVLLVTMRRQKGRPSPT